MDSNIAKAFVVRRQLLDWLQGEVDGTLTAIAGEMIQCLKDGGTVFACGNGGSAAQAEHFVAELAGRFKMERKALRVLALSTNSSTVTAVSNDYGFAHVFSRQLDGVAKPGDCLLALSTSGSSQNVVAACKSARESRMRVFALTGRNRDTLEPLCNTMLSVPDTDTARIQEVHIVALHIICQQVESGVFETAPADPQGT